MSKNIFKIFSLLLILILGFLAIILPLIEVQAQPPPTEIENPLGTDSFTELIRDIIDWLVAIGIGVAVIMIIYSGLLFMTAAGDEEKVTKAKKALTWSLIGLAVLIMGKAWIALIKDILGVS